MRLEKMHLVRSVSVLVLSLATFSLGQSFGGQSSGAKAVTPAVQQREVRAEIEFLASDALQGRGSATHDELVAATYIASRLREFGIEAAGDAGEKDLQAYIQRVSVTLNEFTAPPKLSIGSKQWTHGKEIAVLRAGGADASGPLMATGKAQKGAFVVVTVDPKQPLRDQFYAPIKDGAAGVLVTYSEATDKYFKAAASELPNLPGAISGRRAAIVLLSPEASNEIKSLPEGTQVRLKGEVGDVVKETRNVIGVLHGSGPAADKQVILLGAHMDHLGMNPALKGDQIFNGADDDASGTVAVLELARALANGPKPKRTIYFVLFGSEEKGGWGAQYFLAHPPVPLSDIVADIEFEMIGRTDPAVPSDTLWMTGWERTNLGPTLAKHGAKLVGDPHPEQQFFQRSDNYPLALKGIVAQTISSYGLHKQYHTVEDEPGLIDYKHMTEAIQSLVKPIQWLANSEFVPQWVAGKKP
jgi:hypothetical protein